MIGRLMKIIANLKIGLAPKLSVVLDQFEKTIIKLEQVAVAQTEKEANLLRVAADAQAAAIAARAQIERANAVKTNIKNLLAQ